MGQNISLLDSLHLSVIFLPGAFCSGTVATIYFMAIRDSGIFQNTKVITILEPTSVLNQGGDFSE